MKSIEHYNSDIIKMAESGQLHVIAHGCNCRKTMGAGLARALRDRWSEVYTADCYYWASAEDRRGTFSRAACRVVSNRLEFLAGVGGIEIVDCYNLYTQFEPGKNFDPDMLWSALHLMKADVLGLNGSTIEIEEVIHIGFPKIGCGIGGGDWGEVKEMIEYVFDHPKVQIHFVYKD